jgi:molybdopterin/thiamine biosynthesis adenylyltransferase
MDEQLSRTLALAGALRAEGSDRVEELFWGRRVLVRLEQAVASRSDARETVKLAVNAILRFCANVTLDVPADAGELIAAAKELAVEIHGPGAWFQTAGDAVEGYSAVLNVGCEVRDTLGWVTVSSDGWLARVANHGAGRSTLPMPGAEANTLGALAAACLGAGQVFLMLIERPLLSEPLELSLLTLDSGEPGTLTPGPALPAEPLVITALLGGCGGVAHGWTYAIKRAPVTGSAEAVDHQALRRENIGPYVCSSRERLRMAKSEIVRDELAGAIDVTPRTERLRFFTARVAHGQVAIPELVISALDNAAARHGLQQFWPLAIIDIAAEEMTAQVIVKNREDDGICLLEAYTLPQAAGAELDALAEMLGLSPERVADFESQITEDDLAAAPPEKRALLEEARRRRQPICGRVKDIDLNEEEFTLDFIPAVPFVTAFAGVVAAAQTVKLLLGEAPSSLHFQFSFLSYTARTLRLRCAPSCECHTHRGRGRARESECVSAFGTS